MYMALSADLKDKSRFSITEKELEQKTYRDLYPDEEEMKRHVTSLSKE